MTQVPGIASPLRLRNKLMLESALIGRQWVGCGPVPAKLPTMSIIAQWNHVRELDPGVRWFIAQLREVGKSLHNPPWRHE